MNVGLSSDDATGAFVADDARRRAVRLDEALAGFGDLGRKWVWVARPRYFFEKDGSERADLEPVEAVVDSDFDDESAWWTCHPDTRSGDLAVMYRSSGEQDPDYPVRGPKDLAYVFLATSRAFPLADDPFAIDDPLGHLHGCSYVSLARIEPVIPIRRLRDDEVLRRWGAYKAGFVRAASVCPDDVWDRLMDIALTARVADPTRTSLAIAVPRGARKAREAARLEDRLEDWLVTHVEVLQMHGWDLEVVSSQVFCGQEHGGTIDILCRRRQKPNQYVVVELKAAEARRDAAAQVLGYMGWLRGHPDVDAVGAIVIGTRQHSQLRFVLAELDGLVSWLSWDDLPLPAGLRDELACVG
jgi:hypothetical protein